MAFPSDFIARTRGLLGDSFACLEAALQTDPPVSIRINRSKGTTAPGGSEQVAWCDTGYYLPQRLSFTFDPLFHAGAYYVQEASSMFLEQAVRAYLSEPVKCLDLCAAPGGKSTHLLSVLPAGSLLVSNEVIRARSHILAENLSKWGNPFHIVTNNDPEEIGRLTHLFDVVVTDVPCSGEGMFRKDADSSSEWSVANVRLCASRQRRILHDVWNALKPGGLLIYSTCTYNTEENEENVHYLTEAFGAEALPLPVKAEWNLTGPLRFDHPVYRFFPHKTRGEGFFLAVLRKPDGEREELRLKTRNKKEKRTPSPALPATLADWVRAPQACRTEVRNDTIQLFPQAYDETYRLIADQLRVVTAGVRLGEIKGKDLLPAHSLALSTLLNREAFPSVELEWDAAVSYLKKEALHLPAETAKGYVLVYYKQTPLGFVKHLGNRANNLYPSEWRIRSGYLPEEIRTL